MEEPAWDIEVYAGYAYVSGIGVEVFDISRPDQPRLVTAHSTVNGSLYQAGGMIFVAGEKGVQYFDALSTFRFESVRIDSNGILQFPLRGEQDRSVRIQRSSNLVDWEDWQDAILSQNPVKLIDDPESKRSQFYRAVQLEN